jgi:hypothetical protein
MDNQWLLDRGWMLVRETIGIQEWKHSNGNTHIKWSNGLEAWYLGDSFNFNYHREDGPAIIDPYNSNNSSWWYHGKRIDCKTQEEFERHMRLKAFW